MKALEELKKIKEESLKEINLRETDGKKIKIVIGMGTCGIAAGAREILEAVLNEVNKRNLRHIAVSQTGCIGLCVHEPLMEIWEEDGTKIMYGNLDEKKVRKIIAQHVVNGVPVSDFIIKDE